MWVLPSSAQFQQQSSSAGLRLALLSGFDQPPTHPSIHPPGDSSFTWCGVWIYHWTINESCSTTLWHLVDVICSYPGHNLKYFSLVYNNLNYDNLLQSSGCWAWPSSATACLLRSLVNTETLYPFHSALLFIEVWDSILTFSCTSLVKESLGHRNVDFTY